MKTTSRDKTITTVWNGEDVKKRAEELAKQSSFEIGLVVQGQAKLLAPVDSGRLRASIITVSGTGQRTAPTGKGAVSTDQIRKPDDKFETFVGTSVEYAPYMEYGTVKTPAQPYLRPALDIAKGRALHVVQVGARKEFAEYLSPKDTFAQTNEAFTE
jgi:HK97 gp10 family phage protein